MFLAGAVLAVVGDGAVLALANLPFAGAIGKHRRLFKLHGVIVDVFAALLRLHGGHKSAVHSRQEGGGLGLLGVFADLCRVFLLALHDGEAAVGVRVGGRPDELRAAVRAIVLLLVGDLGQHAVAVAVAAIGANGGASCGSVDLRGL